MLLNKKKEQNVISAHSTKFTSHKKSSGTRDEFNMLKVDSEYKTNHFKNKQQKFVPRDEKGRNYQFEKITHRYNFEF